MLYVDLDCVFNNPINKLVFNKLFTTKVYICQLNIEIKNDLHH